MDRKPCDPVVLIMRALTVFEQQVQLKSLELRADIPEHLPAVNADPQRALQVLSNLIGNAVKFTESGGKVTVRAAAENGELLFSVEDTGRGLDPGDASRVFERFWRKTGTSRIRGTGLGLAIARGIVEAHGGRIWAKSEAGRGAVFTFSLPLSAGTSRAGDAGQD
jgi:signal transduction histidine kinase